MKQFTILLLVAIACLFCSQATAQTVEVVDGEYCTDLIAGQNIDIGDVCVTADNEFITVVYQIDLADWWFRETHLWVGDDLADMPATSNGSPKIGNFPYGDSDLDTKGWAVQIPLASLGLTVEQICLEDQALLFAAHAAVVKVVDGAEVQGETAWGEGPQINEGGSWAMYSGFTLTCNDGPDGPGGDCETAWAFGDYTFSRYLGTSRWGWFTSIAVDGGKWHVFPIYAGAGQNDIGKGTLVGYLEIQYCKYDSHGLIAVATMFPEYEMIEAHFQASHDKPTTAAPGQLNQNDSVLIGLNETDGSSITYHIPNEFNNQLEVFTAFHATVCLREIDE